MHQAWRGETWMRWNDFKQTTDKIQLTHLESRAHEKHMRVWHVFNAHGEVRCPTLADLGPTDLGPGRLRPKPS